MPWEKGQSGNPAGRKAEDDGNIRDLSRAHTEEAVRTLVKNLKAKSERTQVAAAEALLDRGWGKPKQDIDLQGKAGLTIFVDLGENKPEKDKENAPS